MTDPGRPGDNPALVDAATVEVDAVSKWFGQKVAVSGLSCSFGPGVTGLLGPNGAGKTTLLRMLTGLAVPSEGRVTVLGFEPRKEPKVYASLALVPEESAVYDDLTAFELVRYAARLSGRPDPDADARKAIATVELEEDADRKVGEFSKGMRQRAKVAAALANDPLVLVLDEPLNGTDPVQRARLISLFRSLGDQGRTVIVSSHILQEVERMTDRVIAMVDGKLAAAGDITAIRAAMAHIPYRVVVDADDVRGLGSALIRGDGVSGVRLEDGRLHVETTSLRVLGTDVPIAAKELGVRLTGFHPEDDSLESVFRYLVSKRSYAAGGDSATGAGGPPSQGDEPSGEEP
ncbi:MAG TPA: ABC transporter ATP-binding protein [Acidimicrobiia bacterium]